LVENSFPWELVRRIGVLDNKVAQQVAEIIRAADLKPQIVIAPNWYY
jgi:hypothetical protein